MKAVALTSKTASAHLPVFADVDVPMPIVLAHDLLVKVHAIAVNPVDTKVRQATSQLAPNFKILGWDAAGEVVAVGEAVRLFKPGDRVYYAGDITRDGCNAQFQVVDERLVGHQPKSLSFEAAAALPLTAITAWEALFERLTLSTTAEDNKHKTLLIINGAGGVGSIAIQLAKQIAGVTVMATASRPASVDWVRSLGADIVINHHDLEAQLKHHQRTPDYILCNHDTDHYFEVMAKCINPQGRICAIVETSKPVDLNKLKSKSVTFSWEFMFTRSMYQTPDMVRQHHILQAIAQHVDKGHLRTTLNHCLKPINAANLTLAHSMMCANTAIGKCVLSGWE